MSIYSPSQKSGVYVTAVPGVDLGGGSGSGADGATGATGPRGATGPAGNSVTIKGSFATLVDLNNAHPSGNTQGDAYSITSTGHLYAWDGTSFVDLGTFSGPSGATGPAGSAGSAGATGATGAAGASGNAGQPGATGATGAQGATGSSGSAGAQGATGATGSVGPAGATGAGSTGATGPAGSAGGIGASGATGPAGSAGATGAAGSAGAVGATGSQGATGAQGNVGPQGATGSAGSAGAVGATGSAGPAGASGATGPQGTGIAVKGSDTYANISAIGSPANGDCWILTSATGAPTRQSNGSAAQIGDGILRSSGVWVNIGPLQGPVGASGATGPAGSSVTGATGATGAAGPAGATGAAGSVGATGAAGSDGAVGATGSQGATGAAGSNGAIGATGAQGATGPAGSNGAVGATGAQGATGAGFTGATGPAGSGGGGATLEPTLDKWKYSNASSGSPAAGYFRVSGSAASGNIFINANSNTSVLRNGELSNIRVGQKVILRSVSNPATEYVVFRVQTVGGASPDINISGAILFSTSLTNDTEFTLSVFFETVGVNGDLVGTWTWTSANVTTPVSGQFSTGGLQGSSISMLYINGVPKTSAQVDSAGLLTSLIPGDKIIMNEAQASLTGTYTVRDFATNVSGIMLVPVVATHTNYHPWTNGAENSLRVIKGGGVKTISFTITGADLAADGSMDGLVAWKYEGVANISLLGARAICKTAPTGSSAIINVLKNGTSVYSSSANMPTIAAGTTEGNYASVFTNATTSRLVQGDVLTIAVQQKGSTVAGKNLTLTVTYV